MQAAISLGTPSAGRGHLALGSPASPLPGISAPRCRQALAGEERPCLAVTAPEEQATSDHIRNIKQPLLSLQTTFYLPKRKTFWRREKVIAFPLMGCLLIIAHFAYFLEDLTSLGAISSNIFRNSWQSTK